MTYEIGWGPQVDGLMDIYMDVIGYKTDGYFVEVGAFDCNQWSNTYGFAVAGWHGIYYEPQPDLASECRKLWKKYKNIEVCELALSSIAGWADLYLGGSLSTLDLETRDAYLQIPWAKIPHAAKEKMRVDVGTLDIELGNRNWPYEFDVLIVDVEGHEMDVLLGMDTDIWRPKLCVIETHEKLMETMHRNKPRVEAEEHLQKKSKHIDLYFDEAGYDKIYSDWINSIYVRQE